MMLSTILFIAFACCVLPSVVQQLLADGSNATLADKERLSQVIDDLDSFKHQWQQDKANLLAETLLLRQNVFSLQVMVKQLETLCSRGKVFVSIDNAGNKNEAEGQASEPTARSTVKEAHKHTLFVRSDDTNPLVPAMAQMTERLNQVSASLQALTNEVNEGLLKVSSSVYVNWGSSTCPGSADVVYSGVVGGSHYNESGAAANYLCIPLNNIVSADSISPYYAFLYGGEYYTHDKHEYRDPVCVVCRPSRPTNVMIPATTVCPAGWTTEYSGWLMAGHPHVNAASEFICVNSKMEERQGSEANYDGKLLYYTLAWCGSLPCPPYENAKRVTCVVCSR